LYCILCYFGVATLYLTTVDRTTVKRPQFIGQQLTGATVNRNDR